jgi:predicted dehydrogenase
MQRIYLIGAGVIGQWHAAATKRLPTACELHVTDANPATVNALTARFPGSQAHRSAEEMLAPPANEGDIVIVATPPIAHFELAMKALQSGRHVLCEKPLALNTEQARAMLRCAREHGRRLGCCSSRFAGLAASAYARESLNSGELGSPYHIRWINRWRRARPGVEYQPESAWFLDSSRSGGGVLMDWGPYDFAALTEILSPVQMTVRNGFAAQPLTHVDRTDIGNPVEQHVVASLAFLTAQGETIPVSYERAACTHGEEGANCEIELTRGAIRWDWRGGGRLWVTRDDKGKPKTELTEHPDLPELHPHDRPLVYFERALRGERSPAIVDEQAIFNFSCVRAIYDAIQSQTCQTVRLER